MDSEPRDGAAEEHKPSQLLLSEDEGRVLELYDRLQHLQLEIALITAQKNFEPGDITAPNVEAAQNNLLESRARYMLRNEVAEGVIMSNPVLQAVHGGINASLIERDLRPVLLQRDQASTSLAQQTSLSRQITDEIIEVESQSLRISRENVDLASQVLALAEEVNKHKTEPIEDPAQANEIAQLEKEVKASRQRWRVMKATASAVVAGSGVDWASSEELRSIVLDEDDDGV
ncbi:uncharacterized protein JN550_003864 [Neoarthrinium moseri]|uniref:uncharacterized protein n=1 Tax=Neoarthrinium moseri TaxID=1658444 RepID=UPI001FDB41B1|nr:uncharacterized protein JN550_003864 [Neoarthrinium moseri]KAI1872990.1 hypothetical protein JN550_003864 [Neoarthrinium moseri]